MQYNEALNTKLISLTREEKQDTEFGQRAFEWTFFYQYQVSKLDIVNF